MANKLIGKVTCPECKHVQSMEIPDKMCMHSYDCTNCKEVIAAKKSCCVFCDYGDRKCPVAEQHSK